MLKTILKFMPRSKRNQENALKLAQDQLNNMNEQNFDRLQNLFWDSGEPAWEWSLKDAVKRVELHHSTIVTPDVVYRMSNYLRSEAEAEISELELGTRVTQERQLNEIFGPKDEGHEAEKARLLALAKDEK